MLVNWPRFLSTVCTANLIAACCAIAPLFVATCLASETITLLPPQQTNVVVRIPGARVLYDIGSIRVERDHGFEFELRRRIRIEDRSGLSMASAVIRYHKSEKLAELEAYTIKPNGVRSLVDESQYYTAKEGDWRRTAFAYPDVIPGSEIELHYRLRSPNFYFLRPWDFQQDVPVDSSQLSVDIPGGFEYTAVLTGGDVVHGPDTVLAADRPPDLASKRFVWYGKNLAPFVRLPYEEFPEERYARLRFQIARYRDGTRVREFARDWHQLSNDVEDIYEPVLRPDKKWPDHEWLERKMSSAERESYPNRAYAYCRDSIAEIGDGTVVSSDLLEVKKVYKERRGNGIEKNLLLLSMLRRAGCSVYPLLIASRVSARFDSRDRRLSQFDRLLVLFEDNAEWSVLDATTPGLPWGFVRPSDMVETAFVVGHPDSLIVSFPAASIRNAALCRGQLELSTEGKVLGEIELILCGYPAIAFRERILADPKPASWGNRILEPGIHATVVHYDDKPSPDSVFLKLTVEIEQAGRIVGDRIYFRPRQFLRLAANPLSAQQRDRPVSFSYPWTERSDIEWKLPAGAELVDLPDSIDAETGSLRYTLKSFLKDQTLHSEHKLEVTQWEYPENQFDSMKAFFDTVVRNDRGLAVLRVSPDSTARSLKVGSD